MNRLEIVIERREKEKERKKEKEKKRETTRERVCVNLRVIKRSRTNIKEQRGNEKSEKKARVDT